MAEKSKSNEIRLTRVYDAPLSMVWDAWTDPAQTAQWWGPRGFTLTTHSKDFRPGGHWDYTMHGPDGTDYPNKTRYLEIEKHAKLVYDHGGHDNPPRPPMFRVTVLFSESNGKTKMDMTMALPTSQAADETRAFIKKAGGDATWDRLAEYLEKKSSGKDKFVIHRSFDTSVEHMFDLWTRPEHFSRWLPPAGFTMEFIHVDIRPGGSGFYSMSNSQFKMYGKVHYLEIRKPDRLVYTQQFADEQGNLARHPMAPHWPETMLTTVQLDAEGPDRTRVTVTWQPHDPTKPEELDTFIKQKAGMTMGWTGSFDKLEALIAVK